MKDAFILRNPGWFWTSTIAVSVTGAACLTPFIDAQPWLAGIPVALGTVLVVIGEFWNFPASKRAQPPEQAATPAIRS